MNERNNQKGFIQIPLLIWVITSIVLASAGTGVVLHKQGKLTPFVANIFQVFKGNEEPVVIEEGISQYQQELEKVRLEAEKAKAEAEKVKTEAERAKIEAGLRSGLSADGIAEKQSRGEILSSKKTEEIKRLQEEQDKINQIDNLLDEYRQKINEIDRLIIAREEKYHKDVEDVYKSFGLRSIAEAQVRYLTEKFNREVRLLELQKESLRIEYLEKIYEITPYFTF